MKAISQLPHMPTYPLHFGKLSFFSFLAFMFPTHEFSTYRVRCLLINIAITRIKVKQLFSVIGFIFFFWRSVS
ncbi:hypothetical protein RIF29_20076 [Crotalaria pallida]|uniref:Uncharacterized protein n=1 Tax=Crotalaria pallida TaxID=3830 RepID=A0AAN9F0K9_CROPI